MNLLDFSFLDSPIMTNTMFEPSQQLPLAVNPQNAGLYQMQNNILPGEWDWLNSSSGLNNIMGAVEGLAKLPTQQAISAPSASAVGVGGRSGAPKMSEWIQRKTVDIPRLYGGG